MNLWQFYKIQQNSSNLSWKRKDLARWVLQGFSNPPALVFKQFQILSLFERYKLDNFIETGTYLGHTVEIMLDLAPEIYSIEIDKKLFDKAKNKFEDNPNVHLFLGDSSTVLKKVLDESMGNSLFWLDGHYSGGNTGKGKEETPILKELAILQKYPDKVGVVLIDDMDSFKNNDNYPSLSRVRKLLEPFKNTHELEIKFNMFRLLPKE